MSDIRSSRFQRNTFLEEILKEINNDLLLSEKKLIDEYIGREFSFPLILIMGPLRSGTTLFTQWLANTGVISYPSNLLSRFYNAPILGSKIQLMLTDPKYSFRGELGEFSQHSNFASENGKTSGVLAPNEFWYFWRRFMTDPSKEVWNDKELASSMDVESLTAELAGIIDVFQKPFALKGMMFNYNIPFLNSIFDNVLFIQLKRNPLTNIQSILDARKRQLGTESAWYSFKIPEYEQLKSLPAIEQVTGQVHFINKAIDKGMEVVEEQNKLTINYEDFCDNPSKYFELIMEKLNIHNQVYKGPNFFKVSRPNA